MTGEKPRKGAAGGTDSLARLTMNERKFLAGWIQTGTLVGGAKAVRKFKDDRAATSAGWRWKQAILKQVDLDYVMETAGLSDVSIFRALLEGLNAEHVKVFNNEGKVIYSKKLVDHPTRIKSAETAAKIKGMMIDRVKHGLDKDFQDKVKRGVVILPALAFEKDPSEDNGGGGNGQGADEPGQ